MHSVCDSRTAASTQYTWYVREGNFYRWGWCFAIVLVVLGVIRVLSYGT